MKVLRVRHRDARLNVGFKLNRFITDWPSAQSKFISGLADGFDDQIRLLERAEKLADRVVGLDLEEA